MKFTQGVIALDRTCLYTGPLDSLCCGRSCLHRGSNSKRNQEPHLFANMFVFDVNGWRLTRSICDRKTCYRLRNPSTFRCKQNIGLQLARLQIMEAKSLDDRKCWSWKERSRKTNKNKFQNVCLLSCNDQLSVLLIHWNIILNRTFHASQIHGRQIFVILLQKYVLDLHGM